MALTARLRRANARLIAITLVIFALGVVCVLGWSRHRRMTSSASGSPAWPLDVRAIGIEEAMHELQSARGRPVLLVIYASWCGGCRDEMPIVDELTTTYAPKGLEVIALARSDDDADDYVEWMAGRKPRYEQLRLLPGPEGALRTALQRVGAGYRDAIPYSAVFARSGKLVRDWPDGGVTKRGSKTASRSHSSNASEGGQGPLPFSTIAHARSKSRWQGARGSMRHGW